MKQVFEKVHIDLLNNINQSQCSAQGQIFHFKPSILHSTLFSAFLFVSSHSPFIMLLSVICYLLLPRTFFPFTIPSRVSFSRQFLLSQSPSQFLFLFFISSSILLPSPTLSSITEYLFCLVYFTHSILPHIHISNASSHFYHSVVVSKSLHHTTPHSTQSTSLVSSLVFPPKDPQKMLLFLLKASFAITILSSLLHSSSDRY